MHLSTNTWRYLLLATFIIVPIANYSPIVLNVSQDRFTNDAVTRVNAAGYGFSIWGVIFTGMLLFASLQLGHKGKTKSLKRAYQFLVLAGLASIAFVPISLGDNQLLGFVDLLWHLLALIAAYTYLRAHVEEVGIPHHGWTYFAPSMYLGWISAATVISTALALDQLGFSFASPTDIYIAFALQLVLISLGAYLLVRKDVVYGMTVAWALIAVAVEQQDATLLLWGGVAGAVFLGGLAVVRRVKGDDLFYAV